MGVWKIYHKDGTILKDANGNNIDIRSLEYSDSWMGECYLTVTFRHETPIVFMMGDYIIYRNEKFVLNYEPGKDKKARINTCGDGFVYDIVKFNSLQNELSDAEFLDVVLNDNELHYTALPKFQFYVGTLDDLLDRIQANLNEQIGAGKWKIFSRNKGRSEQRGCTADEWNEAYGEGTNNNIIDSASITADTMTCWDALALVNSKWNVNFIVRGRNVYVGTAGVTTEHMFEYGRGNGLYEIEQNADSDQKVITRLRAYGSEKNLPSHYYADLGVKYVANITKVVKASTNVELELDIDYIETYFRNKRKYVVSGESQEQSFGWVLQVTFDFQTVITGYVTKVYNSNKCKFYSELRGTQTDTGDEESKEKLDAFIAQVNSGKTKMYITSGLNKKNVPSSMKEYAENLPNNMSINRLMLPGFPHVSLSDFYESLTDEEKKYVNPTGKQHRFSTDPHRPYIDSVNIGQIGLHSSSQFFDTDDKTNGIIEIYPTIEEMVIGGVRVDEIDEGVAPDDDGRYDGDNSPNNVDIYLSRAIDFDIKDLADDDFSISMKDGRCGGRTFKVSSSTKVNGRWRLTIERVKDDALNLWFPYRDYPIRKGDHFVLTGITLPDSYVKSASMKLLKYAIALLEKNDYTRYVYQPKVDEIFMARQHDSAMADKTGAIKSLHDTLKAGDLMDFRDDDLNISGTITIDQLNIKEQDGKIPTYEITLREDKEVGTIQKIQQQITSLENGNGGSVGGGGITLTQVKGQVATEGSKFFLSKLTDDIANGKITFIKGLIAKGLADLMIGAKFGNNAMITKLGEAFLSAIKSLDYDNSAEQGFSVEKEKNGKYHAFFTNLTIWGKAMFHELEIRKLSYSGGNIYLSGAGSKLIKVVPVKKLVSADGVTTWVEMTKNDAESECAGWKCYLLADNGTTATMNYWQEGDQVRCQTMGEIAAGGAYSDVSNKSYWRTIPNGGVSTQNEKIYGTKKETYLDEDGNEQTREVQVELYDGQAFAWIVIGKHSKNFDGYTEDSAPDETKDIPSAGDTIVLDGNRHRNEQGEYDKTDRQNVIILETTGEYAPRIACYANITEYKHTFTKSVNGSNKEVSLSVFETSPKGGTKINSSRFEWISDDGSTINIINYRGDWDGNNTYHKNDQVNHNNAVWVCVANSGVDVTEEPSDGATYWKKVLSGGKGEKGDDAVSYGIQFSERITTISSVETKVLGVRFIKSVGQQITSGSINDIDFNGSCVVYIDGVMNGTMSNRLNSGQTYLDIYHAFADEIKGKKGLSVELRNSDAIVVASNTFSFVESGEGVVMAYKNATSRPEPPVTKDLSLLTDGWSRTPQKGGSYLKVDNISYGSFDNGASSSVDSTSKSWTDVTEGVNSWKKSPSGLSDNYGWAIMKVSFTTNVDNSDVKVTIKAYSEGNYDFIQVHALDTEITGSSSLRKTGVAYISGNGMETSYSYHVTTAGQHFFYVSYCKDSSGNSNGDYGLFRFDLSDNLVSMPSTVWMSQAVLKEGKAVLPWSTPVQITGDDAYRVVVSPSALIFDTDDNGRVTSFSGKTATIRVYQGDKDVSDQFSKYDRFPSNLYNCNGSLKDLNTYPLEIQVTEIETQVVTDTAGNESTISKTNGFLEFILTNGSANVTAHVDVQVNVAKFTGQMVANNKKFETNFTEISTRFKNTPTNEDLTDAESRITQTAREISLSVSEKSIGRRNLLVGSAFRRQGEVSYIVDSHPYFIRMNDGYDGTNCAYMSKSGMTQNVWCGAMWNPVTVKPNTKYTFSMMLKVMSVCDERFDVQFIDVTYNSSNSVAFDTLAAADKMETFGWTLKKITITTPSLCTKLRIDAFIRRNGTAYMCRPMLEEGENYNGWTLSEQDYDYVGGNMLDNTLSLDKSGSLYDVNGTLTPAGFGESTSIYKSFVYKLKGTVDSFSQLPSSGNVYNDAYFVRNEVTCYVYNGSEFENVGNDYYYEVLSWRKSDEDPFGLEANKDYVFSFMAKGTGRLTAYFYYPDTDVFVEDSLGGSNIVVNGQANFQLTNKWERYWVHWRPSDSLHRYIILRLSRTIQSGAGDAPITNCYIAQPKLEEGARVTEYTERKSDLIDKASLKAAGIEITSDMVELYGNQVKVSGAKGGTPVAMFENGMLNSNLINADKIMARQLQTTGSNGQSVSIENGLMRVYGTNGRCNIEFGVNSNGEAILSYYDKDGKWLYDLGPNKLDGGQLKESTLDGEKYVSALSFFGTDVFFSRKTYINVAVKQVLGNYSIRLFGTNSYVDDDLEIEKNNAAHMGYKPFERLSASKVTTLYRYTAPRQSGTIIKDEIYGLTTPALAKQADGKYFTRNRDLAINGQLANLAPAGYYFRQSEQVMTAPYPMPSAEIQPAKFPAYSIRCLNITEDSTGTVMSGFNGMMSSLMRTIKIQI